jgi:hypothetical protein
VEEENEQLLITYVNKTLRVTWFVCPNQKLLGFEITKQDLLLLKLSLARHLVLSYQVLTHSQNQEVPQISQSAHFHRLLGLFGFRPHMGQ